MPRGLGVVRDASTHRYSEGVEFDTSLRILPCVSLAGTALGFGSLELPGQARGCQLTGLPPVLLRDILAR